MLEAGQGFGIADGFFIEVPGNLVEGRSQFSNCDHAVFRIARRFIHDLDDGFEQDVGIFDLCQAFLGRGLGLPFRFRGSDGWERL
jgi:hypothetical protein